MDIPQPIIQMVDKRRARLINKYDAGLFPVPAPFDFDGATIPWFAWSLIQLSPFGRICGPAVGHDLLYVTAGRVIAHDGTPLFFPEKQADEYFYHRCKATNVKMNWLQERLVRRAVLLFGDYDTDWTSNVFKWNFATITLYIERWKAQVQACGGYKFVDQY